MAVDSKAIELTEMRNCVTVTFKVMELILAETWIHSGCISVLC